MAKNKRYIGIILFTLSTQVYAQDDSILVGDKAKNLQIILPWTMRKCPSDFFATYDINEAKALKKIDSTCGLWQAKIKIFENQIVNYEFTVHDFKRVIETYTQELKLDNERIKELMTQLNKEIEEKNTYKYKPNYGWIYVSVGAALVAVGLSFGVGVWLAKN